MSILLKQVCAFGKFSLGASTAWIVKSRGPAAPVDPTQSNIIGDYYLMLYFVRSVSKYEINIYLAKL